MKYRKKPVEIEALLWTGTNQQAISDFTNGQAEFYGDDRFGWDLRIPTLEGNFAATPGDWIIRGIHGEFYPCKPDIFDASYEAVDDD